MKILSFRKLFRKTSSSLKPLVIPTGTVAVSLIVYSRSNTVIKSVIHAGLVVLLVCTGIVGLATFVASLADDTKAPKFTEDEETNFFIERVLALSTTALCICLMPPLMFIGGVTTFKDWTETIKVVFNLWCLFVTPTAGCYLYKKTS